MTGPQQAARCATLKLLAAFELDRRLKGTGVDVVACHPGIAATEVRPRSNACSPHRHPNAVEGFAAYVTGFLRDCFLGGSPSPKGYILGRRRP